MRSERIGNGETLEKEKECRLISCLTRFQDYASCRATREHGNYCALPMQSS